MFFVPYICKTIKNVTIMKNLTPLQKLVSIGLNQEQVDLVLEFVRSQNDSSNDNEDDEHEDDGSGDYVCDCCDEPVNKEDWCFKCKDYVYTHNIND